MIDAHGVGCSLRRGECRRSSRSSVAALLVASAVLVLAGSRVEAASPAQSFVIAGSRAGSDAVPALEAGGLRLDARFGAIELREGRLYTHPSEDGRAAEVVFIGRGTVVVDPPDAIEAAQLERFTGAREIREPIRSAVFTLCNESAARAVSSRPRATAEDAEADALAAKIYEAWLSGPERRVLRVPGALDLYARGDRFYEGFFAGRFESDRLGVFLVSYDPVSEEQAVIGQFVVPELTKKERRKLERTYHREERKGLAGLRIEDFGVWEPWFSASLRDDAGNPLPGYLGFEPRSYAVDVAIDGDMRHIRGTVRVRARAVGDGRIALPLTMVSGLSVERVSSGGRELEFRQERATEVPEQRVDVYLDAPSAAGTEYDLEVEFAGPVLERMQYIHTAGYGLVDTERWFPRVESNESATYDVRIEWPGKYEVVASGARSEDRRDGGRRSARFRMDVPVSGVSFEIGRFDISRHRVGDFQLVFAFDEEATEIGPLREPLLEWVQSSLRYFEEKFGSYPLPQLKVVTTRRMFSQGLSGFVTLGALQIQLDGPSVTAHEIAHQWWGGVVGFTSYRDQWLSEAMAEYAADAWVRDTSPNDPSPIKIEYDWKALVQGPTDHGTPYHAVGPVVLGWRLDSTAAPSAFHILVYEKGAVVLNILAKFFGDETFLDLNRRIAERANFEPVTTEAYLAALERLSGTDLEWFRPYVYGTDMHRVQYRYETGQVEGGGWKLQCEWERSPVRHVRHRAVRLPDGRFDLRSEAEDLAGDDFTIVVPFQVGLYDASRDGADGKRKSKGKRKGKGARDDEDAPEPNRFMLARVVFQGSSGSFDLDLEQRPVALQLDPRREIYADFQHDTRSERAKRLTAGFDKIRTGDRAGARADLQAGIEMEGEDTSEGFDRAFETLARTALIRMDLDDGDVAAARAALDVAFKRSDGWFSGDLEALRARADLLAGDVEKAYRALRKMTKRSRARDRHILLAIAARALGEDDVYERAMEFADRVGADVRVLQAADAERRQREKPGTSTPATPESDT